MAVTRSGMDRRSNINRRAMDLTVPHERRTYERRFPEERRNGWVRSSDWSSIDLAYRNQYYWTMMNKDKG